VTGVGIDQLEIERLERALARRPRLAERLFTAGERAFAAERARPAQHLAARFCAKEAVAKALALEAWSFTEVEVVGGGDGPPRVRLHGAVAARAAQMGVAEVHVSLTHTRRDAAAVAIAIGAAGT
jgi:holo-[acyl-carrier protein] synthase